MSSAITPFGVHTGRQHVAVVAVGGDDLVAFLGRHLQTDHDGFLPDVQVAEPADEAHTVELAGLLFEAPDQQHLAQCRGSCSRLKVGTARSSSPCPGRCRYAGLAWALRRRRLASGPLAPLASSYCRLAHLGRIDCKLHEPIERFQHLPWAANGRGDGGSVNAAARRQGHA